MRVIVPPGRVGLQEHLESVLGHRRVYFQPPENIKLSYPAIVYERESVDKRPADNGSFILTDRYRISVISRTPEHPAVESILELPTAAYVTHFVVDGLHHDVINVFH